MTMFERSRAFVVPLNQGIGFQLVPLLPRSLQTSKSAASPSYGCSHQGPRDPAVQKYNMRPKT